ncbi:MAG TPA: deoxyribose-phosphate aldolase [Clostridia bacterium]|nr:deoxyribose-phosphate aldolase [Clostridia bacterium]
MATTVRELAQMIDHSLLHPTMDDAALQSGCALAQKYATASVCIKPYAVKTAAELLAGSTVKVGTVCGFPHGNSSSDIKAVEAQRAIEDGAEEVDMVINIGKALSGEWDFVRREIALLNKTVTEGGAILKVIFENDFLEEAQIVKLCDICSQEGAAFIKTSTGFGFTKRENGMYAYDGATLHDLKLMLQHAAPGVQVKAAGGIRSLEDLLRVKALGVTRVGATATAGMLDRAQQLIDEGIELESLI